MHIAKNFALVSSNTSPSARVTKSRPRALQTDFYFYVSFSMLEKSAGIPIIDISGIEKDELSVSNAITEACSEWGFFLIKGHGIPEEQISEMLDLADEFFQIPESEKGYHPLNKRNIGYVGPGQEYPEDDKFSMWWGGIPKSLDISDDGEFCDNIPKFWYPHIQEILEFKHQCYLLASKLLRCFAISMGLAPEFFTSGHREDLYPGTAIRMLKYPRRPERRGKRLREHTDSGSVTLLFQTCQGLEIRDPQGNWFDAPCLDGHVLINIGDALQFWSGNKLKSTPHRVSFQGESVNYDRMTMAYFLGANSDVVLDPLTPVPNNKLIGQLGEMQLPEKLTAGEYNRMVMESIYKGFWDKNKSAEIQKA